MTEPTDKPRLSRVRRQEAMLNSIAKLIGCTALVVTVAVVFYVIVIQLDKAGPRIDPAYVAEAAQNYRWSGAELSPKDSRLGVPRPVLAKKNEGRVPSLTNSTLGIQSKTPPSSQIDVEALRPAIEEVVRNFFLASSVAEKAACSRDRERVQPLMEIYYQTHPLSDALWQKLGWVLPMDEPGHHLAYAQSLFADGEPVCLIIERLADSALKVDWESSVRYSELDWKEFLSTRPDHPTLFRVIASKPIGTVDAATSVSVGQEVIELKHPAEQGTVYAYFNRDDPQFRPLLDQLQSGNWTNVPLTLRLCYPGPTSNARAVRIAGVEGKGWLILHHKRS